MQAAPAGGAMVAIQASEAEVLPTLEGRPDVAAAAFNSPSSTVVSGAGDAVLAAAAHWQRQGRKVRRLAVSHAFHSPLMDGVLEEFRQVARALTFSAPAITVISNLTGRPAGDEMRDAEYWVRHIRQPVRFHDGVRYLREQGAAVFYELSPHPTLAPAVLQSAGDASTTVVPVLRAGRPRTDHVRHRAGPRTRPRHPPALGHPDPPSRTRRPADVPVPAATVLAGWWRGC